jgi:hypothetical protein
MDRETQEEFLVVIQAKDMGGHMGGLSGSTTVTVTLSDVNDNPPKFPQSKLAVLCLGCPLTTPPVWPLEKLSLPTLTPARCREKEMLGVLRRVGDLSENTSPLCPPPRPVPVLCGGNGWAWHPGG